jgi:hypothetical protein
LRRCGDNLAVCSRDDESVVMMLCMLPLLPALSQNPIRVRFHRIDI